MEAGVDGREVKRYADQHCGALSLEVSGQRCSEWKQNS